MELLFIEVNQNYSTKYLPVKFYANVKKKLFVGDNEKNSMKYSSLQLHIIVKLLFAEDNKKVQQSFHLLKFIRLWSSLIRTTKKVRKVSFSETLHKCEAALCGRQQKLIKKTLISKTVHKCGAALF